MATLKKILNSKVLILLNLAIILVVELYPDPEFFLDAAVIHIMAIIFMIIASYQIFQKYSISTDPIMKRFMQSALLAMVVFAGSHVVEFLSYSVFDMKDDAIFANVANFYLFSIIAIILGSQYILSFKTSKSMTMKSLVLYAVMAIIGLLVFMLFVNDETLSLEPESVTPYIYLLVTVGFGILALINITRIKKAVPLYKEFSQYLYASIFIIILAIAVNVGYEILEEGLLLPGYQIIYISHFLFYVALSIMFLSFSSLTEPKGIYKDVG